MTTSLATTVPTTITPVHSCDAKRGGYTQCSAPISSPAGCKETKLDLTNTNTSKACTSVSLFWGYPIGNLTTIFATPFTQKKQAYNLHIDNEKLKSSIFHVYRLQNGQEKEVTTTAKTLIQHSDDNYQVILKFSGPRSLLTYGVFINYNSVRA